MSILKDIKEQLELQNSSNEKVLNYLESQGLDDPDAKEKQEDAQKEENKLWKGLKDGISSLKDSFFGFFKKGAKSFLDIITENLMMMGGIVGIKYMMENWGSIQKLFDQVADFIDTWQNEGSWAAFKTLFAENKGVWLVAAGIAALAFGPFTTALSALRLSISGLMLGFKGAAFLAGFLGPWGVAALAAAGLASYLVVSNRAESEAELLEFNEKTTALYDATNEFAGVDDPAPQRGPEAIATQVPVASALTPEIRDIYQSLQGVQNTAFDASGENLENLSEAEAEKYREIETILQGLRVAYSELNAGINAITAIGSGGSVITGSTNMPISLPQANPELANSMIQAIDTNNTLIPDREVQRLNNIIRVIKSGINASVNNVISNEIGETSIDSGTLTTVTP